MLNTAVPVTLKPRTQIAHIILDFIKSKLLLTVYLIYRYDVYNMVTSEKERRGKSEFKYYIL
jgi:hypothetical protein